MQKILSLNDWLFDNGGPGDDFLLDVAIHFKYPDISSLVNDTPAARRKEIDRYFKDAFKTLISRHTFPPYKIIGSKNSPRAIKTTLPFGALTAIEQESLVANIYIEKAGDTLPRKKEPLLRFFCVKMTIAIEIEGQTSGLQSVEDRFVLIKALSFDEAYDILEKRKDEYAEPYLNTDGQFVRWRIESFDDCFDTGITDLNDLDDPAGVEVYSKLRNRRLKK